MKQKLLPLLCVLAAAACAPNQDNTAQSAAASAVQTASAVPQAAGAWTARWCVLSAKKTNTQQKTVEEESAFSASSAKLDADGAFAMTVDLASVKTNIDIRDQRLRDWVFETAKFPQATVLGRLDAAAIDALKTGGETDLKQPLVLEVHGQRLDITADLRLKRTADDTVEVSTAQPVVLDVQQMDMAGGVAKLVEVMGLASIDGQIPVMFAGTFVRKP